MFPNLPPAELGLPVRVIPPSTQLLAPTPPMGYNNWARYECNLDEKLFTDTADWMVAHGLLAAGYDTITVDDCWMTMDRDPVTKALVVNTTLFPQGMGWLGQYFHRRGFKFGIYEDAGEKTCGGYPGSLGHFDQDIAQFVAWEVDYIKLDGCYIYRNESLPESETLEPTFRQLYEGFGEALRAQPRPIVYSESAPAYFAGLSAGTGDRVGRDWYKVMTWVGRFGQLWRHSTDIAVYKKDGQSRWPSVMTNYRFNIRLARFQKPGNWNDPDFIITGDDVGLTIEEQKSQFALWTIMASPLILSTNVKDLTFEQIAFLTNKEIIGINQDPVGIQGRIAWRTELSDVLVKPLQDPTVRAAAVLNKQHSVANVTVSFARLGYTFPLSSQGCQYLVRELFSQSEETLTVYNPRNETITSLLRPHATALFKITSMSNSASCRASMPTGSIYLTSSLLCLDVFNSETTPGTPALAFPCTDNDNQLWQTSSVPPPFTSTPEIAAFPDPKTLLWIKTLDNLCLDTELTVSIPVPGSQVVVNPCDVSRETQQWTYDPMQGTLFHASSGFCVDAPGATTVTSVEDPLIALRLWKCGEQKDSQVWSMPA
ncbi:alpha-galactosidase [Entomortierella parvispora]|uniref:Alpha-galactosidase n=1 Tax=Entomortierella parvispora TaxID=205924 RepID=A0A9P3LV29_9FUNG|nr:alpha-galactosidase [Entomortierella parvispora]